MRAIYLPTRRRSASGFTLIEVMIVIAIVLALAGLVGLALFGRKDEATASLAQVDMKTIERGLKQFRLDYDRWPTDEEGVAVLWSKETLDPEADEDKWKKYLEEPMPSDRWGNEWGYRQISEFGDESDYDLWSFGPDGEEDTEDDLKTWDEDGEGEFDDFGGGSAPAE